MRRVCVLAAGVSIVAGCNDEEAPVIRQPRPPVAVVVSTVLAQDGELQAGPRRFGAGLVELVAVNQTKRPVVLRIYGPRRSDPLRVPAGGNAVLQLQTLPGRYRLQAQSQRRTLDTVTLEVGAPRPTSQNRLDLP